VSACLCATVVCATAFVASVVRASDGDPDSAAPGSAGPGGAAASRSIPGPPLSQRLATRLDEAILVVRERLRNQASCRALFTRLGADGATKVEGAAYYPASAEQERKHCRRGVSAVTTVGASAVGLCRSFVRLSGQEAAIILIHEALHLAGQNEYPSTPEAPDSLAITQMVMAGCRLF
jgi:hypothetical protein